MNRFIKWLTNNKKRSYEVQYIATGFMGNRYIAGTFEFKVSDNTIKKEGFETASSYGFYKNYKKLSKHFPVKGVGNLHQYTSITRTIK